MRPAIILSTLRAEGGPALAIDLAAEWNTEGHTPVVFVLSDCEKAMLPRLQEIGVSVHFLGIDRAGPRDWPAIVMAVARALIRSGADSIVSIPNGVHGAIFAGAAIAGVTRRIVHVGNYPWHWQAGFWKYRVTMQVSAPLTPDLVCVTEHVRKGAEIHFGHIAKRLHVVPNGVDLSRFAFRGRRARLNNRLDILMVSRLDVGKDHATLIRATAILRARGVDANLRLAGEGHLRSDLEALAMSEGVLENIHFLGPRGDVPELLSAADVFAFSVRAEEGLGIALVEAMAVGTPIVATDVGACREVLANGECGRLVPEDSPEVMADALITSAIDADRIVAARRRSEAVYSRRAMADGYRRILGFA